LVTHSAWGVFSPFLLFFFFSWAETTLWRVVVSFSTPTTCLHKALLKVGGIFLDFPISILVYELTRSLVLWRLPVPSCTPPGLSMTPVRIWHHFLEGRQSIPGFSWPKLFVPRFCRLALFYCMSLLCIATFDLYWVSLATFWALFLLFFFFFYPTRGNDGSVSSHFSRCFLLLPENSSSLLDVFSLFTPHLLLWAFCVPLGDQRHLFLMWPCHSFLSVSFTCRPATLNPFFPSILSHHAKSDNHFRGLMFSSRVWFDAVLGSPCGLLLSLVSLDNLTLFSFLFQFETRIRP